ncbi:MAG: Gfo/Idh/MocA family oxidoreductase [Methylobacteriaceae bacterium]|nr:Gfo/Idh/MocA family oxidoreductase [Methylobacteriaceae bacterium]
MAMNKTIETLGRRLRLGVIGGGPGSFIGEVHRTAARLDDNFEIVAGVLSSDAGRSRAAGRAIGLAAERAYGGPDEMFKAEAQRPDGIEVVAIMTPNDSHHPLCAQALARRLDVICDKPLTRSLADALDLVARVREAGVVFCNTFNYAAFPMVRQARAMARTGDLGDIRMVHVEYVQGHNAGLTPGERGEEALNWHFRSDKSGPSLILADIGSHAHHIASFVTGLAFEKVCADVRTTVPGRNSHDYAGILFELANGAPGMIWVTQAAAGAVHGLHFRVFGAKAGLEWFQEEPNRLIVTRLGEPALTLERGGPGLKAEARRAERTGIGHPEGYQEAFAALYADVAEAIVARRTGRAANPPALDFPTVEDGARTMKFIEAALVSTRSGGWVDCRLAL